MARYLSSRNRHGAIYLTPSKSGRPGKCDCSTKSAWCCVRDITPIAPSNAIAPGFSNSFTFGIRYPAEMGAADVEAFLSHLAIERHVSSATQNQALNALAQGPG